MILHLLTVKALRVPEAFCNLQFSGQTGMLSASKNVFISFHCLDFTSFPFFIEMARTSSTTLDSSEVLG